MAAIASRPKAQVLLATHSPIVASIPGATIVELGDHGLRPASWADLEVVDHYRRFLQAPQSYLRHVVD